MKRRKTKSVLGIIILTGIIVGFYLLFLSAIRSGDFQAYYFAAEAAIANEPFIGHNPPTGVGTDYVYPPITILVFLPFGLFDSWGQAYQLQVILNIILSFSISHLTISHITDSGVDLDRIDMVLITGVFLFSAHAVWTLAHGQMNLYLLALITLGYLSFNRKDSVKCGILFAFASLMKVFPALYGLWLLRERDFASVATATITGTTALFIGYILFGFESYVRYFEYIMTERSRVSYYQGGMSPNLPMVTLNRPLSVLFPDLPAIGFSLIPALLLLPIVIYTYSSQNNIEKLVSFLIITISIILVMPSNQYYVLLTLFPLVPLLYLLPQQQSWWLISLGAIIANTPFAPTHIEKLFEILPLPSVLESVTMDIIAPILTFGSVTLYGLLLILTGCIAYMINRGDTPQFDPLPSILN